MRINKYIASCGVASRRKAEEIILNKRVKVNGEIVNELSFNIDENKDIVEIDGKIIRLSENNVYIVLNKPEGYITTVKDQFNRPSVLDLVTDIKERVYPIGRLDYEEDRHTFYRIHFGVISDCSAPKYYRGKFVRSIDGFNQSA